MMWDSMDRDEFDEAERRPGPGPHGGPRCMPHGGPMGFDGPMGPGPHCMPRGPHGPGGFGPHGPHGRPPRRPDSAFLKRRVEEADLLELIDMAGRMAQRRPSGGPARGQALILSILAGRETISQRELQQMLAIQPGSLSELVSKLEARGCLTREKAEDRRGNLLRITEAGRAALPQAGDQSEDDPFAPLSEEQQDQMAAMLRTLLNHWVEQLDREAPRPAPPAPQKPVQL